MSKSTPGPADTGIPKAQLDLIQQFEADYNAVDRFLRKALGADNLVSFTSLVRRYEDQHMRWSDGELLRVVADVRNFIVHSKTEPYRYAAVPTPQVAQSLGRCRERLLNPVRAIPRFARHVQKRSVGDTLASTLEIVRQEKYSQFPVYEGTRFRGLLTENGITRWLAGYQIKANMSLIDLQEVTVGQVLEEEESRRNYSFIARQTRVDDVAGLFASQPLLEAALITDAGKETESLLGICTRWDVIQIDSR